MTKFQYNEQNMTYKGIDYHFRVFMYPEAGETDVEVITDGQYLYTVTTTLAAAFFDVLSAIDGKPRPTYTVHGAGTL